LQYLLWAARLCVFDASSITAATGVRLALRGSVTGTVSAITITANSGQKSYFPGETSIGAVAWTYRNVSNAGFVNGGYSEFTFATGTAQTDPAIIIPLINKLVAQAKAPALSPSPSP
jgi:hypothetical protein